MPKYNGKIKNIKHFRIESEKFNNHILAKFKRIDIGTTIVWETFCIKCNKSIIYYTAMDLTNCELLKPCNQ